MFLVGHQKCTGFLLHHVVRNYSLDVEQEVGGSQLTDSTTVVHQDELALFELEHHRPLQKIVGMKVVYSKLSNPLSPPDS